MGRGLGSLAGLNTALQMHTTTMDAWGSRQVRNAGAYSRLSKHLQLKTAASCGD